jgi:hypothetical protein
MSEIKVNKLSPRTNCGTVQLGDSGDTITIPAGATITNNGTAAGFGATGAASWDTTVKTSGFTAVSGVGYFVNTTSGAITVTLPASPDAGAVVAVKDYANTFDTNNVTLARNGSNIGGEATDATLLTEGLAVTLVYVDATKGWLVTDSGLQDDAPTAQYVTATGGTITCCGDYRIHTFTGPGTLCVSCAGNAAGSSTVDYMVVAGGGGGGAGGGGGGGFRESPGTASGSYTVSPLGASPAVALPVPATSYPITVGAGGAKSASANARGSNGLASQFSTITSAGGGGGGTYNGQCSSDSNSVGGPGGSGGGGGAFNTPSNTEVGGTGNTPPTNPPQGNTGGNGSYDAGTHTAGGGGGGASAVGAAAPANGSPTTSGGGGLGGDGVTTSITGSAIARSGGGGGGVNTTGNTGPFPGGTGGGGAGVSPPGGTGTVGTTNTGGGGGGGSPGNCRGANGGSGIVVIRYKFQN